MNTFINDKIASFTHDALLIFHQFPNLTRVVFTVTDVLLENMPPQSIDGLFKKEYLYSVKNILPGKSFAIRFVSVPTI